VEIKSVKIGDIKPYPKNPRVNSAAIDKVVSSIKEFGFQQPLVLDGEGVVIVGHTRLKAAIKMGMTHVPAVYAEGLTPEQTKAYRLADNKTQDFSEWDYGLLAGEFEDLKLFGYDLNMTAFDPAEISSILQKEVEEDTFDIDEALENIVEPKSRVGDVFLLGEHRLMCGDSTTKDAVDILMGGTLADMVFTDPPYNVNYTGSTGKVIKNDNQTDSKFYEFLLAAFTQMGEAVKSGGGVYVCHADLEGLNFRKAMKDSGWQIRSCIIWVKNTLVMGRADHHWQHEPILYTWKDGDSHKWYGGRKNSTVINPENGISINKVDGKKTQITLTNGLERVIVEVDKFKVLDLTDSSGTTIWNVDKPKRNGSHPTMKPLKLCAKAIRNSSQAGDIVLDPFGGSGSTLMTCEQMDRKCFTMELDPVYCDIIIQRWEEYTNKKAVRVGED
jgi:DNA modification methylase